ncbi:hypothetical protein ACQCN2_06285 [Brevibacillus ginsengisoli]|uniref:hypothetical protein n=1 Tax=Brevibacillus ginsengisoli TaxID=363854 RepID=UPI003CF77648
MEERGKQGGKPYDKQVKVNTNSSLDEEEIERRHQFQMLPTPDEKHASEVITKVQV